VTSCALNNSTGGSFQEAAMRPYIICHMLSSVGGKIDGAALDAVTGKGEYEATGAKLKGDAWITL